MRIDFNLDEIISITLNDKRKTKYFEWLPEKTIKFLFRKKQFFPAGFYHYGNYTDGWPLGSGLVKDKDLKDYIIENNKAYSKPYIIIRLKGDEIQKTFNSYKEAEEYIESLKKKTNINFETIKY